MAFRRVFRRIPRWTAVDEASVESIVVSLGYKKVYVPDAIIRNKGAENIGSFLSQRRHYYAGCLLENKHLGYKVSAMSGLRILGVLLKHLRPNLRDIVWTLDAIFLEVWGRVLGWCDFRFGRRDHVIWGRQASTKEVGK